MGASVSLLAVGRKKSRGAVLLKATRAGDEAEVDEILKMNPAAAGYCTLEGVSSLHVAAGARRADLLQLLLISLRQACSHRQPKAAQRAFSKAINQKNVHGQTPLMLACKAGSAACVQLLLEAGADATLFDDLQQRTCLHYAALYGWADVVDALLEDEVMIDTTGGERQVLREALIADSQGHHRYIDGRAGLGLAPMHLAASQGHLAAVKCLLKWGASLTVRCNIGFSMGATEPWTPASTPLHFAAAGGKGPVVQAILQAAAEQQRQQRQQQQERQPPDIRLLQDFRGQRPYDIALGRGHRPLLWALDPRVPLQALLLQPAAAPAVPPLAALAAAALRLRLEQQLAALSAAAAADKAQVSSSCGSAAQAAAAGGGGRHGGSRRGSRTASREGTAHGGTGYGSQQQQQEAAAAGAAGKGLHAAVAARLTCGMHSLGRQVSSGPAGGGGGSHRRHASEGGDSLPCWHASEAKGGAGGSLHGGSWRLRSTSRGRGGGDGASLSGSRRGGGAYAALFPGATPQPPLQQQQVLPQGSIGSPSTPGLLALAANAALAGSIVSHQAATSVTSCAGCPVCLDSGLEVAAVPCGHGLCLDCAQHLCSAEGSLATRATPPQCPLCRAVMGGFTLLLQ